MRALLTVLLLGVSASAQEVRVLGPDPAVVRVGDRAIVRVTFVGDTDESVELAPLVPVDGLRQSVGRRAQTITQKIVDGRLVSNLRSTWKLALEPTRQGEFSITPPRVVAAGREYGNDDPVVLQAVLDESGARHAFLRVEAPRERYYVHEEIPLRLRFGFDRAFFDSNLIPMFRAPLDVPAHVHAPWLQELPGTDGAAFVSSGTSVTFALNDRAIRADSLAREERDGRAFTILDIEHRVLATRSGPLVIPTAWLRFAYASEFEETFLDGRVPVDRRDAIVYAEPRELEVLPLPEANRPKSFAGAVGQFTIRAEASPTELAAGESVRLRLTIEGRGNFASLGSPDMSSTPGFQLFGSIETRATDRAVFTYDLAPRDATTVEVPAIEFSFFDPDPPGAYRTVRSAAIPLRVSGRSATDSLSETSALRPGVDDIFGLDAAPRGRGARDPSALRFALVSIAPWLSAVVLWLWIRARDRRRTDPLGHRARRAAARYRSDIRKPGVDPTRAFVEYVAARLRTPTGAIVSRDLGTRLTDAGTSTDLAERTASTVESMFDARFAQTPSATDADSASGLVEELERAFRAREHSR